MLLSYSLVVIIMSLIELILFSYDKVASSSKRFRIPVYVLMMPIGFGGALGALGSMLLYRHKNTKIFFKIPIYFSAVIQAVLWIVILFTYFWRQIWRATILITNFVITEINSDIKIINITLIIVPIKINIRHIKSILFAIQYMLL